MESVSVQHMICFEVNVLLGGVDDVVTFFLALDEYDGVAHLHIWSVHIREIHSFRRSSRSESKEAPDCSDKGMVSWPSLEGRLLNRSV